MSTKPSHVLIAAVVAGGIGYWLGKKK